MVPGTIFLGLGDTFIKRLLNTGMSSEFLVGFNFLFVGVVGLSISVVAGIPDLQPGFWAACMTTVVINIFAQLAFYKAFQRGEASFVSAMRLITPPLVLITGFFILGEKPSVLGVIGVLTTIAGLWFLVGESFEREMPLRERIRQPVFLYALAGAVGFAFSFPFDKQAVMASSAIFFIGVAFFLVGVGNLLLGYLTAPDRKRFFHIPREALRILPFSLPVHVLGSFMTIQALNYSLAAYASSVKRLWSFWGVLFSGAILKEKNIGKKLWAVVIMLAGIVLTVI